MYISSTPLASGKSTAPPVSVIDEVKAKHNCHCTISFNTLTTGDRCVDGVRSVTAPWLLIITDPQTNSVLTSKHISIRNTSHNCIQLSFSVASVPSGGVFQLIIENEVYRGLRITRDIPVVSSD